MWPRTVSGAHSTRGIDQAVEIGAGVCAPYGVGERPGLASDHERPDGVLDPVRVQRQPTVVEDADELGPLAVEVPQGLAGQTLRGDVGDRLGQPRPQLVQDRTRAFLADPVDLIRGTALDLPFDPAELLDEAEATTP